MPSPLSHWLDCRVLGAKINKRLEYNKAGAVESEAELWCALVFELKIDCKRDWEEHAFQPGK